MNDIKIENNDIVIRKNGYPKTVSGMDEIIQLISIAASVRKGSFAYDRNLGLFSSVPDFESENILSTLESLVNESLICSDVYVNVMSVRQDDGGYYATVVVSDGFREKQAEVKIYG